MTQIDLEPRTLDLLLYAGDGVNFRLVVTDKDDEPIDLTGEVEAQIRVKKTSEDPPAAEFTIDSSEASDGIVGLSLTGEQTQGLVSAKSFHGVWDVQWIPTGGEPRTFCQGKVKCGQDVSR